MTLQTKTRVALRGRRDMVGKFSLSETVGHTYQYGEGVASKAAQARLINERTSRKGRQLHR
jgi:hypothetical protein